MLIIRPTDLSGYVVLIDYSLPNFISSGLSPPPSLPHTRKNDLIGEEILGSWASCTTFSRRGGKRCPFSNNWCISSALKPHKQGKVRLTARKEKQVRDGWAPQPKGSTLFIPIEGGKSLEMIIV